MLLQTLLYKFLFRCLLSVVLSIYQEVELLHTSNVMFTILSNQTGFHNSCTISHSHQQCTRVPISLQLCQHLLFSVCFFIVFVFYQFSNEMCSLELEECQTRTRGRGGAWTWEFLQGPAQSQLRLFFDTRPSWGKVEWDKKGKKVLRSEVITNSEGQFTFRWTRFHNKVTIEN